VQRKDEVVLTFTDGGEVSGVTETDWDKGFERWKELRRGKRKI
jgi:hypothetical protein